MQRITTQQSINQHFIARNDMSNSPTPSKNTELSHILETLKSVKNIPFFSSISFTSLITLYNSFNIFFYLSDINQKQLFIETFVLTPIIIPIITIIILLIIAYASQMYLSSLILIMQTSFLDNIKIKTISSLCITALLGSLLVIMCLLSYLYFFIENQKNLILISGTTMLLSVFATNILKRCGYVEFTIYTDKIMSNQSEKKRMFMIDKLIIFIKKIPVTNFYFTILTAMSMLVPIVPIAICIELIPKTVSISYQILLGLFFITYSFVPAGIYLYLLNKDGEYSKDCDSSKENKHSKIAIITIFILMILPLFFIKNTFYITIRNAGIFDIKEQSFFLKNTALTSRVTDSGFKINNGSFKAYNRYSMGSIRLLCTQPFNPHENKKPSGNCIIFDKGDITSFTMDTETQKN